MVSLNAIRQRYRGNRRLFGRRTKVERVVDDPLTDRPAVALQGEGEEAGKSSEGTAICSAEPEKGRADANRQQLGHGSWRAKRRRRLSARATTVGREVSALNRKGRGHRFGCDDQTRADPSRLHLVQHRPSRAPQQLTAIEVPSLSTSKALNAEQQAFTLDN